MRDIGYGTYLALNLFTIIKVKNEKGISMNMSTG